MILYEYNKSHLSLLVTRYTFSALTPEILYKIDI